MAQPGGQRSADPADTALSRAELADAVKALGPEGGPVTSPAGRCCVSAGSDPLDALHGALTR